MEELIMKRTFTFVLVLILSMAALAFAMEHMADIKKHPACKYCGMDRQKFSHSRIFITYEDASETATCSIHCAALDLALNTDKTPKSIQVADFNTRELIDAEKAAWVVGGDKMGVMTKNAKWAFASQDSAQAFIKEHGGALASFDDALKATFADMYNDTDMIRTKRTKMKSMNMGGGHKD